MTDIYFDRLARARTGGAPAIVAARAAEHVFVFVATLFLSGFVTFTLVGNVEGEGDATNPLARLTWYPLYLAAFVVAALQVKRMASCLGAHWPFYLLMALSLASVAWSILPDVTLRRAIAVAFTALIGLYFAARGDWLDTLRLVGLAWLFLAVAHLLMVGLAPQSGVDHGVHAGAWKGWALEKNQLGGQMSRAGLLFAGLIHLDKKRRRLWLFALALAGGLVLGSRSTTGMIALAAPLILFVVFLLGRTSAVAAVAVSWAAAVAAVCFVAVAALAPDLLVGLVGKDTTLTGRTDIWAQSAAAIAERPWTGWGYGAYWTELDGPAWRMREALDWVVPSAHNAWLDIAIALGLPGLAAFVLLTLAALGRLAIRLFTEQAPWPLLFLLQILVFSASESILWLQNTFITAWFVALVCLAFTPARRRGGQASPVSPSQPRQTSTASPNRSGRSM